MKTPLFVAGMVAAAFLLTGCGGDSSTTPAQNNSTANNSSPVVQPEIYAQKKVDLAALNQAVQQYNAQEGHNPQTLQELKPNYISKIPDAPAGYKFNYDATSGTVTLVQQ
jgi:PBP1b-binding outer membrane lipoprotein LpoB